MRRITLGIEDAAFDCIHQLTEDLNISQAELVHVVFGPGFELSKQQADRLLDIKAKKLLASKGAHGQVAALKGLSPDQAARVLKRKAAARVSEQEAEQVANMLLGISKP